MSGGNLVYLQEFQELLTWIIVYFLIFTLSWIPIWRNSERSRRSSSADKKLRVAQYGWQTRKRKEWKQKKWASYVLMHPRIFYEGIVWFVLYILAALSTYHAIGLSGKTGGALLIVASELTLVHGVVLGTWTIAPFYWDMPFWGCLHLSAAWVISVAVAVLYGVLHLEALWFYLPVLAFQTFMMCGNWIAWLLAGAGKNSATRIGNPFKAFYLYGLEPKSFTVRDFTL